MLVVLTLLVLLAAAVFAVSWKLSSMVVRPDAADYDKSFREDIAKGTIDPAKFEGEYARTEYTLHAPSGCELHCVLIPRRPEDVPKGGRERVVVLVHGYTVCLLESVKYVDVFRDLGFHCILYDNRNHGRSGKGVTTMGLFERDDLSAVCDDALLRFGGNAILGTHGESMGGAIVMMQSPVYKKLSFVIEDCGYSDLGDEIAYRAKLLFRLPRFPFVPIASALCRLRGGARFSEVVPKDAVAQADPRLPMLFLHGGSDTYVPTEAVRENFAAKRGNKRMRIFENAGHAESLFLNREAYAAEVRDFLRENRLLSMR